MKFDYSSLRGKIIEEYGTIKKFSKKWGVSYNTASRKLNNKNSFSLNDIEEVSKILDIVPEEIPKYFFNLKVYKSKL